MNIKISNMPPSKHSIYLNHYCQTWKIMVYGEGFHKVEYVSSNEFMTGSQAVREVKKTYVGDWTFKTSEVIDYCGCHMISDTHNN